MMREGSLDPPVRHPIPWQDDAFLDEAALEAELRRVFDICHGCRRCFNLCDSFPRLFDLIDQSASGELDGVPGSAFKAVTDACTLCDLCFMTKCPYVPPHRFDIDFPHLMLRTRAVALKQGHIPFAARELTKTDRNGQLAGMAAPVANWATDRRNELTRPLLERVAGVHHDAALPRYHGKTFALRAKESRRPLNAVAPAYGRKAVLFATCFVNYNNPAIGEAALSVLCHNGVETEVLYPGCCGMPQLEHGDFARVTKAAVQVAEALIPWVERGYQVVLPVPSCALMVKFEWPLIVPADHPLRAKVETLAKTSFDLSEYIVGIARKEGLAPGLQPLADGVTLHIACHARAQNMGHKAAEMLRLIPSTPIKVIERCSGHGGSWGVMKDNFETALKVGKPVASQALRHGKPTVVSECPLAGAHIVQGMERLSAAETPGNSASPEADHDSTQFHTCHPIEILARSYGLI